MVCETKKTAVDEMESNPCKYCGEASDEWRVCPSCQREIDEEAEREHAEALYYGG